MDEQINKLLIKIKQNKKYKSLSNEIVLEEIKTFLKSNPNSNSIEDKQTIKIIRAKLHRLYSSYQTKKKRKKDLYLEELEIAIKGNKELDEITKELLSITLSTKERLEDYNYLYKEIFKITQPPKTIIDLGAGLNPLSFPLMNIKNLNYYAFDIDLDDMSLLNKYFKIMKQKGLIGKAAILDVRDFEKNSKLPFSDIVFMFKLIDLIDEKNKKISEKLIIELLSKTKFIVASFATKTLTRKPMNIPRRIGFEKMLERNKINFQTIKTSNEIFYVIKS